MEQVIKSWKFHHSVYQDEQYMGTFTHTLTLICEPEDEKAHPSIIFTILWEIPALGETTKAQIYTLQMVIHDHRNLFAIPGDVLQYLYDFGFCLDNSLDPDCQFIQQNHEYDEQG